MKKKLFLSLILLSSLKAGLVHEGPFVTVNNNTPVNLHVRIKVKASSEVQALKGSVKDVIEAGQSKTVDLRTATKHIRNEKLEGQRKGDVLGNFSIVTELQKNVEAPLNFEIIKVKAGVPEYFAQRRGERDKSLLHARTKDEQFKKAHEVTFTIEDNVLKIQ